MKVDDGHAPAHEAAEADFRHLIDRRQVGTTAVCLPGIGGFASRPTMKPAVGLPGTISEGGKGKIERGGAEPATRVVSKAMLVTSVASAVKVPMPTTVAPGRSGARSSDVPVIGLKTTLPLRPLT